MKYLRCWEYKKCERQAGGRLASVLGTCPASAPAAEDCWLVAGTMCNGTIQGTYAQKYDSCIICDYYNKLQEFYAKKPRTRFLMFGQYLCSKGIISDNQIIEARALQLRKNQKIGVLAINKGFLTDEQVERILIIQESTLQKFGELAIELGFMGEEQLKQLLMEQEDSYLFFGEALVRMGVLSEDEMFVHLKEFNEMKLRSHFEKERFSNKSTNSL